MNQEEYNNIINLAAERNRRNDEEKSFAQRNAERAGKITQATGEAARDVALVGKTASFGGKAAGYGMQGVGKFSDALGNVAMRGKYTAPLAPVLKGIGKASDAAGKATVKGSEALNNGSSKLYKFGKDTKQRGKQLKTLGAQMGAAKNLSLARQNNIPMGKELRDAVNIAKDFSKPFGALSYIKYIRFSVDWLLAVALGAAIIKDILDWVGFSLPAINEAMNFCVGITIMFALMLMGAERKTGKIVKGQMKKWFTLLGGVVGETFFGLNFLPIETAAVIVCYLFVLQERKQEEEGEGIQKNNVINLSQAQKAMGNISSGGNNFRLKKAA